jgi:hypothetical protein
MSKILGVMLTVFLWNGMAFAAEESGSPVVKPYSWAVGYDEGLSGKIFLPKGFSANLSLGYTASGADSVYRQPTNSLLIKVGGGYLLKQFNRLCINGFVDFAEIMNEGQLAYTTMKGPNKVYYQWSSSGRIGLAPEFFLADHFSITYKFGLSLTYVGTTYTFNADESGLEKKDNSYTDFGVLGFQKNAPLQFLHNISFYVYF